MAVTPFTLDEQAHLSDEEALRRDADRKIRGALRWTIRVFSFFTAGGLISRLRSAQEHPWALAVVAISFLLLILLELAFRWLNDPKGRLGRRLALLEPLARILRTQPRAVALTYLVVQLWVCIFVAAEDGDAWLMILPWIVLVFRFAPAERVAIHAVFILSAVICWLVPITGEVPILNMEHVVLATVLNVISLGLGLFSQRRYRKKFMRQWRASRGQAQEQLRMRQELEYAREIQLSMLPRETPRLDWLDLASVSLPATEVGGDYFDFFFPAADRVVLVSADVAGHGLGSGLVLSGVRSSLALLSDELDQPDIVMERIHRMLRKTSGSRMLVTMALLSLDRVLRMARYATAGHPPLLIRRGDGKVEEILRSSLPLGASLGEGSFSVVELSFATGDVFVLHTDGVYETRDLSGDLFGLSRMIEVLKKVPAEATAQEIMDRLLHELAEFRGSAPQEDDLTLVVAKVK